MKWTALVSLPRIKRGFPNEGLEAPHQLLFLFRHVGDVFLLMIIALLNERRWQKTSSVCFCFLRKGVVKTM